VKSWNDRVTARSQISPFGLYTTNPTRIYYKSNLDFIRLPAYRTIVRSLIQPSFMKEACKRNFRTNTSRIPRNTVFDTPYSVSHNETGSHDSYIGLETTKRE
jgi:hypothetical protein